MKIVNFQITPYNDDIAAYVNNLNSDQIYKFFDRDISTFTSDLLTAVLLAIYKLKSSVPYNNISCIGIQDTYPPDDVLFSQNINELEQYPNVFVLVENGIYEGHVYAWTVDMENVNITNIIGAYFRDNICQLKDRTYISVFLNSIETWTKNRDVEKKSIYVAGTFNIKRYYIRIIQPNSTIRNTLSDCGLYIAKGFRNQENMNWILDNTSLGKTPLADNLILREYDYIIDLTIGMDKVKSISDTRHIVSTLKCVHPEYEYIQI